MRLEDLHHVVAAAAQITGEEEWVVIGSQSILGTYPDAPSDMQSKLDWLSWSFWRSGSTRYRSQSSFET